MVRSFDLLAAQTALAEIQKQTGSPAVIVAVAKRGAIVYSNAAGTTESPSVCENGFVAEQALIEIPLDLNSVQWQNPGRNNGGAIE